MLLTDIIHEQTPFPKQPAINLKPLIPHDSQSSQMKKINRKTTQFNDFPINNFPKLDTWETKDIYLENVRKISGRVNDFQIENRAFVYILQIHNNPLNWPNLVVVLDMKKKFFLCSCMSKKAVLHCLWLIDNFIVFYCYYFLLPVGRKQTFPIMNHDQLFPVDLEFE